MTKTEPPMSHGVISLTVLAMLAFAGNSLLCRLALGPGANGQPSMEAGNFTALRLLSGAVALALIVGFRERRLLPSSVLRGGSWASALALFVYAVAFSYAYLGLSAASGALILFGSVQVTMVGHGLWMGERLGALRWTGLATALAGLVGLLLPGLAAPPLGSAGLMMIAGIAWGVYSLRGRGSADATSTTAGNFLLTLPLAVLFVLPQLRAPVGNFFGEGWVYALLSGALASGVGYAIWYAALPRLPRVSAATVQLSVPVLTALGGVLLLQEALSLRVVAASVAILGGIAMVVVPTSPTSG